MSRPYTRYFVYDVSAGDKALLVVLHGIRQIRRGRNPAMWYGQIRNPRRALKFAFESLGFKSFSEVVEWLAEQPIAGRHQRLTISRSVQAPGDHRLPFEHMPVGLKARATALMVTEPRNLRRYQAKLDLATRPVLMMVTVVDADEVRYRMQLRINHEVAPGESDGVIARGVVRSGTPIKVRTLDGKLHPVFPGQPVQIQILPHEERFLLEFI